MRESRELLTHDLQASPSEVPLALSHAGVSGVQKAIRIRYGDTEKLIAAEIDCTVDLAPARKGVHMSRFPELFEEAIEEVVIGEALLIEGLAEHIAAHIVERQRARGTLFVGTERTRNAEQLVRIVEGSMSSPVYELLKRPDELFVVEHAHLQPRFVEDSVRISLRDALAAYPDLDDGDFLLARQVNLETIHSHDVVAERYGTAGELRGELEGGEPASRHTELREWLT